MPNTSGGGWKGRLARPWAARERRRDWARNADPAVAQARVLSDLLETASDTAFGRDHRFAEIAAMGDPAKQAFQTRMDDLNAFMAMQGHRIPKQMRKRLREYFHQSRHVQVAPRASDLRPDTT